MIKQNNIESDIKDLEKNNDKMNLILKSEVTCPFCSHMKVEVMPTDACKFFYECENCKEIIKPKKGDCCIFCSYGSVQCPSIQEDKNCCDTTSK